MADTNGYTGRPIAGETSSCRPGPVRFAPAACLLAACLHLAASAAACRAEERHVQFLNRLEEGGYYQLALRYLEQLEQRGKLPAELAAGIELRRADLMISLSELSDAETERRLLRQARSLLTDFLANNAGSPEADWAHGELARIDLKDAQRFLTQARFEEQPAGQAALRRQARAALTQAKQRFAAAVKELRQRVQQARQAAAARSSPVRPKPAPKTTRGKPGRTGRKPAAKVPGRKVRAAQPAPRARPGANAAKPARTPPSEAPSEAEEKLLRLQQKLIAARLNQAMVDYYLALTYDAQKEQKQRKDCIKRAVDGFEGLFQEFRGTYVSLVALLWQARAVELPGTPEAYRQALMRYDEILASEPDRGARMSPEQLSLFLQAHVYRLRALNRRGEHDQVVSDGMVWLRQHPKEARTDHGLGIQLEVAKAMIGQASRQKKKLVAKRTMAQALQLLDQVTRRRSPYQTEAFRLRQKHGGTAAATVGKRASFDEAMLVGDAALSRQQWSQAAQAYQQALDRATAQTKADQIDAVSYRLAYCYYQMGKRQEAVKTAETLLAKRPDAKVAPQVAAIALAARTTLLASTRQQDQRREQLEALVKLGGMIERTWPDHSVADSARRTLGSALLTEGRFLEAADVYQRVSTDSPFHSEALYRAATAYWNAYLSESNKPPDQRDTEAMGQWVEKSRAALRQCLAAYKEALSDDPLARPALDAQLLLAEITLRTGDPKQAQASFRALFGKLQQAQEPGLDESVRTRIVVGTLEAMVASGNLDQASDVVAQIEKLEQGQSARITLLLVQLGQRLQQQLEQLQKSGKDEQAQAVRQSFQSFLQRLAERKEQTATSLQYLAESYFRLGQFTQAAELYERLADQLSQQGGQPSGRELTRVRLRRAVCLRHASRYEQALAAVEELLGQNQRLLPALVERCRVLQEWGEQEPSKQAEAIRQWYDLSRRLAAMTPPPQEYYEARFGIAYGYYKLGDKARALRWLRSTMTTSPALGGPEMKARFEELLAKLQQ